MAYPQSILITGASSGIGAALARFYAGTGVRLCLTGRDETRLSDVAGDCRRDGAAVEQALIDVTDRRAMNDWIVKMDDQAPLDLVIANAGISGGTGGQDDGETVEQARRLFAVNVDGVFNTVEPVLPRMLERKHGQVALMSSLASFSGWPGAPSYSATKGAVRLYGEALRGALIRTGVQVNVICPGFIRTPMTDVNNYSMPFMIDADQAAAIIARRLKRNKGRIAFPWQTYILAGFFGMMPYGLSVRIFSRLPEKPEFIE